MVVPSTLLTALRNDLCPLPMHKYALCPGSRLVSDWSEWCSYMFLHVPTIPCPRSEIVTIEIWCWPISSLRIRPPGPGTFRTWAAFHKDAFSWGCIFMRMHFQSPNSQPFKRWFFDQRKRNPSAIKRSGACKHDVLWNAHKTHRTPSMKKKHPKTFEK